MKKLATLIAAACLAVSSLAFADDAASFSQVLSGMAVSGMIVLGLFLWWHWSIRNQWLSAMPDVAENMMSE